jgi:LmbE family N-acetylglucosaminyl deacetylase
LPADLLLDACPASAMAIYAHPDDPDVSCGGTLARWSAAGCEVTVVICALGDKGSAELNVSPDEVVSRRTEEAEQATKLLGVRTLHSLGRRDGEIENDSSLRGELVKLIRRHQPDTIVCPDPTAVFFGAHHYNHRDHRVVGWAALDATAPAASSPLYFPGAGPPHGPGTVLMSGSLEPDVYVDISESIDAKLAAVSCHQSQLTDANDWFASAIRAGAEEAGRQAGVPFAEAFRRLELA